MLVERIAGVAEAEVSFGRYWMMPSAGKMECAASLEFWAWSWMDICRRLKINKQTLPTLLVCLAKKSYSVINRKMGFMAAGFGALKFNGVKVRNRYTKFILIKGEKCKIPQNDEHLFSQISYYH